MKRGDIYYADLNPTVGSEQGGIRPVIILQNDIGNRHSPTIIIATITSTKKLRLPIHAYIGKVGSLTNQSFAQLEQIRTIDKKRVRGYVGTLALNQIEMINNALKISVDIG